MRKQSAQILLPKPSLKVSDTVNLSQGWNIIIFFCLGRQNIIIRHNKAHEHNVFSSSSNQLTTRAIARAIVPLGPKP